MRQRMSAAGLVIAATAAMPVGAMAQQMPAWPIAEICAKEPPQCAAFETRAREAVSGGWGVLPQSYRTACLGEVKSPLDRSWRLLSQCLELQALKGLDKNTIATAATPAEPVPLPKPKAEAEAEAAPSPTGVPPPPFGLPSTPPPAN